ncbi:hypothetical protein ACWOCD_05485 [Enterococcus silesiacus]|uniref:hypothetical protein n=1 Tax=Enterococcus silesiacus TaxID=332949 RepID=UPI0011148376|nr:hypothetical protein [Enterococcus silesiacus]
MRKVKKVVCLLIIFVSCSLGTVLAKAESSDDYATSRTFLLGWLDQYPKWKNIDKTTIPVENSFFMRHTSNTKAIDLTGGAKLEKDHVDFSSVTSTGSVRITNVGFYNGKSIDTKVSVSKNSKSEKFTLGVTESNFLDWIFNTSKNVTSNLKYEFFISKTNTPIAIGQYMDYKNIDENLSIYIVNTSLESVVSKTPTYLIYDKNKKAGLYLTGSEPAPNPNDPKFEAVVLFPKRESITLQVSKPSTYSSAVGLYYNGAAKTDIETSELEGIESELEVVDSKNTTADIEFVQTVPYKHSVNNYYKNYGVTIPLEKGQLSYDSIEIKDMQDKNASKNFNVKVAENEIKIEATAQALKQASFYDNIYKFKVKYKIDYSKEIDPSSLDEVGYYNFETTAQRNLNGVVSSATAKEKINFNSSISIKHHLDGKPIADVPDSVEKKFLTQKMKISTKITNHKLVSYTPSTIDLENHVLEKTTDEVILNYKHLNAPLLSVAATTLTVDAADNLLHLKGNIKLDELEDYGYTLHLAYNKQNQVIDKGATNSEGKNFEIDVKMIDVVTGKMSATLYVTDEYGNQSNVIGLSIEVFGILQFTSAPIESDFGTIKIPNQKTYIKPKEMQSFKVGDFRGPNKQFNLTVSLIDKTQNNQLSTHFFFKKSADSEMERLENGQAISIYSGKTQADNSQKEFDIDYGKDSGLFLEVTPEMKIGSYEGNLIWTLEDVPK